jgi:NADH:ubiquinone oxidoreductase subunit E
MTTISESKKDVAKVKKELQNLVAKYGNDRTALKPILHAIQQKYHGISNMEMQILADILKIHAIEVQEVVSFYGFYNTEKKGKYIIRMCQTMPCKMADAKKAVAKKLEKTLGIKFGETTRDGKYTLEWVNCLGMCDQGPALLINEDPHTKVTEKNLTQILKKYK